MRRRFCLCRQYAGGHVGDVFSEDGSIGSKYVRDFIELDSSVSIEVPFPVGERFCLIHRGHIEFLGVIQPGREADHSPLEL
jgi:hypothetical protein